MNPLSSHYSRQVGPNHQGGKMSLLSLWKQRLAGLESARVRQLTPRDEENARLTRLVGDFTLDQVMVPDVLLKQFSSPRACAPWGSSCGATIWSASYGPTVQPGVGNRRLAIVAAKVRGRCSGRGPTRGSGCRVAMAPARSRGGSIAGAGRCGHKAGCPALLRGRSCAATTGTEAAKSRDAPSSTVHPGWTVRSVEPGLCSRPAGRGTTGSGVDPGGCGHSREPGSRRRAKPAG